MFTYTFSALMFTFSIHFQLSLNGLTGEVKFDYEGLRTDFVLDVIELTMSGMQKVGEWTTENGFFANRPPPKIVEQDQRSLVNKSFVVITAIVSVAFTSLLSASLADTHTPLLQTLLLCKNPCMSA